MPALVDQFGNELKREPRQPANSKFDSAQTTAQNAAHWQWADLLSPNAAANHEVRQKLAARGRYEFENNSYLKGMVRTLAYDTIGTGPRLQMQLEDTDANQVIEDLWHEWFEATDMAAKLITGRITKCISGETFAIRTTNPMLDPSGVTLDYRFYEPDHVRSPFFDIETEDYQDGIRYVDGNYPVSYDVLKRHPGDNTCAFPNLRPDPPA